jgi:hypothetical protein
MEKMSNSIQYKQLQVKCFIFTYSVMLYQWLSECGPLISSGAPGLFREVK